MDYHDLLHTLNPFLRRRLRQVASLAEISELEALTIIVESGIDDLVHTRLLPGDEQS